MRLSSGQKTGDHQKMLITKTKLARHLLSFFNNKKTANICVLLGILKHLSDNTHSGQLLWLEELRSNWNSQREREMCLPTGAKNKEHTILQLLAEGCH